jgi:anti-sigma regulatory factor (Ser/Thr protein kinase)
METAGRTGRTTAADGEFAIAADASAPAKARAAVGQQLEAQAVPENTQRAVLLVVSELVSNAVVHGSLEGDEVGVMCSVGRGLVRITVSDAARTPTYPEMRPPDTRRSAGRGLQLVDRHASCWTERIVNGRREVVAELPL